MPELTDAQKLVRVRIPGDPDNSGTTREGIFEFALGGDSEPLTVTDEIRTQTRATPGGTILTLFDELAGENLDGNLVNKDIVLNLGNSQYAPQLTGAVTADQRKPDGTRCQWGDTGDETQMEATDATGQHPLLKSQCLAYWFRGTRTSSAPDVLGADGAGPAIVEFGEYRASGVYDPLKVVFESPTMTISSADGAAVGSLTLRVVEVADLGEVIDATQARSR